MSIHFQRVPRGIITSRLLVKPTVTVESNAWSTNIVGPLGIVLVFVIAIPIYIELTPRVDDSSAIKVGRQRPS